MSVEHVIPKSLFSKNNRQAMVTVPSCVECNNSFGKDVEYFKNMILIREDVVNQPTAKYLVDTVSRALTRDHKMKSTKELLETTKDVDVITPAGIYLGKKKTYKIDIETICRVVERSIRGLYYSHTKQVVPLYYTIRVVEKSLFEDLNDHDKSFIIGVESYLKNIQEHSLGNGTVKYKFIVPEANDPRSIWKVAFYKNVIFWGGITNPR